MSKSKKPKKIKIDDWIERDLTASARDGVLPPAFEVDDALRQVEETLLSGGRRSPVLVGPRGVGKTAVYHALAHRLLEGGGPPALKGARIVQISFSSIAGRFPPRTGQATNFMQRFFDHLLELKTPLIPLIRDVHVAYALDWEATLHRYLTRSKLPVLAESLPGPFDEMMEYSSDLTEFLVPIVVDEPPIARVRSIVQQWNAHSLAQGQRPFEVSAQSISIELTARYMGDRCFPRKVLDLLEQTRVLSASQGETLGINEVVQRFSHLTRVPPSLVDPRHRLDLDDVREFLESRLLGQREAVDALERMIALIKAGLTDLRRPFGVLLFVGPTGVGKTHAAQLLAEYLFGDRQRLIRINMADHQNEADVGTLFGNVYGQTLSQKRGILAGRLAGHPFGVLLLDEFEKAHTRVHDAFLQLIDEGRFINGMGETVSAASMIIIATSNAGVEVFRETGLGFRPERDLAALDKELDRRLLKTFRFEFLNRFDHVVHFHPLDRTHIRDIAKRELTELTHRDGISRRSLTLEFAIELLDWVVAHGYHPHYGARFLRREIEREVTAALANFLVRNEPPAGTHLEMGIRRDQVYVRACEPTVGVALGTEDESLVLMSAAELKAEAQRLLARFAPLAEESAQRAEAASALIVQSQAPGFWDDQQAAQGVLRHWTALDARRQADLRLLESSQQLHALLALQREPEPEALAALVGECARSHRSWTELSAAPGPSGGWLVIGPADPTHPPGPWLGQLVSMYRGWFQRRELTADVVAEQRVGGQVHRVVFEVEGAGVMALLQMEYGRHRRKLPGTQTARALVDLLPRSEQPITRPGDVRISDAKRNAGVFVERLTARLEVQLPSRGLELVFNGTDKSTLALLGADLHAHLGAHAADEAPVARTYGYKGSGARDPRTNATAPVLKDVLRGQLEPFLRAWESQRSA
jgi:ATP-dependent Clp protease ATP-binding subunit ClpA